MLAVAFDVDHVVASAGKSTYLFPYAISPPMTVIKQRVFKISGSGIFMMS